MAITQNHTHGAPIAAEPDYSTKTTLEIIDQLEFEMDRNPGLPQGLVWEVVARLAATEAAAS